MAADHLQQRDRGSTDRCVIHDWTGGARCATNRASDRDLEVYDPPVNLIAIFRFRGGKKAPAIHSEL